MNTKKLLTHGIIIFFVTTGATLLLSSCCEECECDHEPEKAEYWEHFIAHAGGAIDGINYTNCVEAMDLSYSKGCRLFELDLTYTTDGKIVAAHDSPGVTEEEFMNTLIHGKYTPMNMQTINDWFRRHPDAILVTDKINDPQRIYDEFWFRDKVIMELFTWEAVDKANILGIKPMVSENLIFGFSKKAMEMGMLPEAPKNLSIIEQILEDKQIEYVCMSRYYQITDINKPFLKRLKNKGIKNYVFHLELPLPISGISAEQYVWEYEMDYCHGMYANDLDLLASLLKKGKRNFKK